MPRAEATVARYLVARLEELGVRDAYGIPGGPVLGFLYEADASSLLSAHLSYSEQGASFSANGYAQVDHSLGVAYATRGPGFTNLITGIADAYADSLPVLFLTAHSRRASGSGCRFESDQELDAVGMVRGITKFAASVDDPREARTAIDEALSAALSQRKGPVLLDFLSSIWGRRAGSTGCGGGPGTVIRADTGAGLMIESLRRAVELASGAKRPVVLVGDGLRQSGRAGEVLRMAEARGVPVLSSRCSQDVASASPLYFGYVGSHGVRYANRIFAESDFVLSLGNRLAFPVDSESYRKALRNKSIVRVEVDDGEIGREVSNCLSLRIDLSESLEAVGALVSACVPGRGWPEECGRAKDSARFADVNDVVSFLSRLLRGIPAQWPVVADVGNNEFWLSRAYELAGARNRVLYSKSFGALGCGIPKAVGACHRTGSPTVCVVGDQGFQFNAQELELVSMESLPLLVVVVNNRASGMIRDREGASYGDRLVHTTPESGYGVPRLGEMARAYGIAFESVGAADGDRVDWGGLRLPAIVECLVEGDLALEPSLPKGNEIYDMDPAMDLRWGPVRR